MEEYSPSSSSLNTTAYQHSAPHQDTPLSAAIDNSDSSSDLSSLEDEDEEGDTTMVDRMDRTDLDSTSPSSIRFIEDTLISKTCPLRSSSPDLPIAQLVVSRSAHSPPPRTPSLLSTSDKSMTLPSLNTLQAIPSRTSTKRKRSPPSSSSSSTTIAPDTDGGPAVPDQQFATVCTVTSLKATSEINQLDCLPCQSTPYAASIDEVKEGDPYELVVLASPLTTGQGNFQIPPSSSKSGSFQTTMSLLQSTPMTKKTKRTLRQPFTLIAEEEISQRKTRDKSLSSVSLRTLPPKKAKRGTDQISSITSSTPIFADDDEAATNSSANLSFSTDKIDQDKSTKKLVCEEACDTSTVPESVYISRKQNHRMSRTTNASIVHDLIDTATRINTSQSNNQKEMVNNSLVIDKENHDTVADQDKGNKEEENEARDHGRDVDVDGESGDNPKNMKISRPKGRSRGNKRFDQILLE